MEENIYAKIGRRIREERKAADFTLEELAEKAGLSSSFITYIECGKKQPTLITLARIDLSPEN